MTGPGLTVRTAMDDELFEQAYAFYTAEWWTRGRPREDVRDAFERSVALVLVLDDASGEVVGLGRAVGDGHFQCTVNDIIVRRDQRGRGIGGLIMRSLLEHPALEGRRVDLTCLPEMDGFYARFGFAEPGSGSHLLRRVP